MERRDRTPNAKASEARPTVPRVAAIIASALATACAQERERDIEVSCITWENDIGPTLEERCSNCHSGPDAAGSYDLTSYGGALGPGSDDQANAVAGDPESTLLAVLNPAQADATHAPFADLEPRLRRWTVGCDLALRDSSIHEPGILNPRDPAFHGALLRRTRWDFERCERCHGQDGSGGPARSPCTTCHEEGPTACVTCHRPELRASGAHDAHVSVEAGPSGTRLTFAECERCHVEPASYDQPGHLVNEDGTVDRPPAEVRLRGLAAFTPPMTERDGSPQLDSETGTCANVYCHGDVGRDAAAELTEPRWYLDEPQAFCGSCHGTPPADHAQERCGICHQEVVDRTLRIVDPSLHIDGLVQLGRADEEGCADCHGRGSDPAPPTDLLGRSDPERLTVGAHRAHLTSPRRLRGPIPCTDCHRVPEALESDGHIDDPTPAEVFPGGASFGGLAAAGGAVPDYDFEAGTCADVYCHGGGDVLAGDRSPDLLRTPVWNALDQGQVACGTCHGVPPQDGSHAPELTFRDCAECHTSVDAFGNVIVRNGPDGPTSQHIDGDIDVR